MKVGEEFVLVLVGDGVFITITAGFLDSLIDVFESFWFDKGPVEEFCTPELEPNVLPAPVNGITSAVHLDEPGCLTFDFTFSL